MRTSRPVLQDPLISQRNPFEVYLLIFGVIIGIAILQDIKVSATLQGNDVGGDASYMWALFVLLGSATALIGITIPPRNEILLVRGLQIERFGLTLLSGACVVFSVLVAFYGGADGRLVAGQNLAFTLACLTRIWQITRRFGWYQRQED